ncbi:arsenic resistance N-acetyltransferase ArsN2 [Burkholderia anthina]|uniref:arsenic resistance N-acetyltransferase ArsN2 n=1 Tax=Burkholderia anthina TaxID=179879 RepID=UPI001CF1028E|nr:arsenic resistance N-acetyltransferase ArsN2 [Burkholderia anthina]MCA8091947.1 arsenic resistance N-acetyltransferase ArsN2 [Burkholderia anthina]
MEIRPATVNDLASIEALLHRCGLPVVGVSDHVRNCVVAMEGSTMCGCGGFEHYGDAALLRSIAVAEHARGAGLGRRIVARSITAYRLLQVRSLVLLTTTAEDYFARLGFVCVARDDVPPLVRTSSQFQGVCPGSAVSMLRVL